MSTTTTNTTAAATSAAMAAAMAAAIAAAQAGLGGGGSKPPIIDGKTRSKIRRDNLQIVSDDWNQPIYLGAHPVDDDDNDDNDDNDGNNNNNNIDDDNNEDDKVKVHNVSRTRGFGMLDVQCVFDVVNVAYPLYLKRVYVDLEQPRQLFQQIYGQARLTPGMSNHLQIPLVLEQGLRKIPTTTDPAAHADRDFIMMTPQGSPFRVVPVSLRSTLRLTYSHIGKPTNEPHLLATLLVGRDLQKIHTLVVIFPKIYTWKFRGVLFEGRVGGVLVHQTVVLPPNPNPSFHRLNLWEDRMLHQHHQHQQLQDQQQQEQQQQQREQQEQQEQEQN